jgi:hypothetical protein
MNEYYPPSDSLKRSLPYDNNEAFFDDLNKFFTAACRLKLISESKAEEVSTKAYDLFRSDKLDDSIREIDPYFDGAFPPDPMTQLYPALAEEKREEFLYTFRGLILG